MKTNLHRESRFIPVNPLVGDIEYAIRDIIAPAKKLEKAGRKILYLNIGDPLAYDFSCPKHFREAAAYFLKKGNNGYSDSLGTETLRLAIVEKERKVNGISINANRTIVTNGVSEGIRFTLAAMLNPKDEILIPGPGYPP
ncbi:MAG: aminotransferase class I/II-fold pyridoxal phosphate-dependent enzyme, partial [Candidatus Heimdallarchaeota archaeon]|nr:aminotransferase class I/II-fold pyridoxal phosphate-dependent enzyme [Candidatus Heimdallarchaeota archaeon]